jgi:AP-2 complex subunit mu-1
VLRTDVSGQVLMKAYLSGMPECKFGLNDKQLMETEQKAGTVKNPSRPTVELDDCQFHQCVKLSNFEETKTINFIPPDGEFELMKYRSTEQIHLPFKVQAVVNDVSKSRVEYKVVLRAQFPSKVYSQSIVMRLPAPPNVASTKISVSGGKAKYNGSENCLVWK